MLQKFFSLLALLGWFYISVLGIVVFSWLTKGRLGFVIKIFYLAFSLYALLIGHRALKEELVFFKEAKEFIGQPYSEKLMRDKGTYYETYYQYFRPRTREIKLLNYLQAPSRELFYARLYLYPTFVFPIQSIEERDGSLVLIGKNVEHTEMRKTWETIEDYKDDKFILDIDKLIPKEPYE